MFGEPAAKKIRSDVAEYTRLGNFDTKSSIMTINCQMKATQTVQRIYAHNLKTPIKWKLFCDGKLMKFGSVDETVNKKFLYGIEIVINAKLIRCWNFCNGSCVEYDFSEESFGPNWNIQIKILYQADAITFCSQPIVSKESENHLPKMITQYTSRFAFCDVKFNINDKVLAAHKVILADRSAVFRKMFSWDSVADPSAKADQQIRIEDCSFDHFKIFIDAIYFGSTPSDPDVCMEMISLAEKYDIQDVKTAVEATVVRSLKMENAIRILIHSYLNNSDTVKKAALAFCACNRVNEMSGHKLLAKYPELMSEVFNAIALEKRL